MNWAEWTPQENIVISIREVLEEALVPDNEIQRNVQQKLKIIQNIGDYTYYLLFIMSNPIYSEEIRSLSGILLKNNICSIYATLTQDDILKIRQECLRLMKDPSKDIRASISNVLVIMAKDNLKTWPELVPFLVNSFEVPDDGGAEVGLKTLFSICEELIRDQKSDDEIYGVTREVFPKLNDFLSDERCAMKHEILRLFNQFLQDYFPILKQSVNVDTYLRNVMQLADNEDPEMQKYVCQTFVIFLDNREDCLLPHIQDIIVYLLAKTEHNDCEIALQACEFWLTASKLMNCKDLLGPFLDKLIPILLKNMIYSELELHAIKDSLGNDADIKDLSQDIYPVHISNGSDEYDEMVEKSLDDMDDFYVGWTLRKCSAASLDGISVKFGAELLPVLIPFLNELLLSHDYFVKESAILALGAIAEGCVVGLRPHLPFLINYLIEAMEDEHSIVRVIACWTLSRYVNWIINISPSPSLYFIPVMTVLLKHFVDDNKRVQRAAISAFCIFQEEAQSKLVPYIDFILEGFQQGFQRFHCRSLYLLYDAIGVLAQAVGGYLNKPEYLNKLLPPLMEKITQCDNFAEDHFVAVLECLASIIPVLELAFLPFSEVVYWHCLQMISDTLKAFVAYNENPSELDMPYKEPMNVAHDVLYSMALGLKTHFVKYVTNSNLVLLLRTTMQDDMVLIRQTAVALYGELVVLCFPYLANNIHDYVPIIVKNLDDRYDGVCNNAAWVLGKLCTYMGSGIQSYLPEILGAFVAILENPIVSKPMYQTVAVSFCILCYIFPDIAVNNIEILLRNCCMTIRNIKDTDEKDLAFRGLCKMVVYHPNFCKANFMYFCDAVASWNEPKLDLKEQIRSILVSFKDQCGENSWDLFYHQCPDALKMRKCPPHLVSPLIKIVIEETRNACRKQPTLYGFNPSDNAYEPLKLMQTVMAKTNEVCLRYLENSMLCSLPAPGAPFCATSTFAVRNGRRRMEDRHVIINDLSTMFSVQETSPSSYYAIFDGHAGHDAAAYSAAHLHQFLAESKHFGIDNEKALREAFNKTDALFVEKCKVENFSSGTTAVCALLLPKEKTLYIAWAGDSQALLVNQGKILQCVDSHKPDRKDERYRIESQGGSVIHWGIWRVNGQLAVSRAIGDADYKPFVIAEPEIREISLDGGEDFLILACDGLWDHLSEEVAAHTVYNMVYNKPDEIEYISEQLTQQAKENGSCDNISVIVVFLRDVNKIAAGPRWADRIQAMDTTSVDNNPFGISNGTNNENILATHDNTEGLLLNLTDNYKNGTDHVMTSPQDYFTNLEQTSCKRDYDEDLDDMGPETDVDAVDDVAMSPIKHEHVDSTTFLNNNPFDACSFPTKESKGVDEKESSDNERSNILESLKQYRDEENSSPVHIETGHDVSGLVEGTADSDSEDEWNYVRGEEANKENQNPVQPTPEVDANLEAELDDTMSQLNPNAIEFIPVSPTHTASPACLALQDEDRVIAQSPKKAPPQEQNDFTIDEPNDFDFDIKNKPSEIETEEPFSNGHHKEDGLENGHNGDSETDHVVSKVTSDEFHFGPNATPFTPTKSQLDESQVSTRALFGDETIATLGDSFSVTKNDDPMSMSFYQDEDTPNPFEVDLNKVQALPEDVNAFISDMNDTISDLPEHDPLDGVANPDNERLVTDLDVIPKDDAKETLSSMTDEKEVMSPLSEDLAPFKDNETVNEKADEVETVNVEAVEVETLNVEPVVSQQDVEPIVEEKQVQQVEQSLQESMANQIEEVCEFMSKQDEPKRDVETPVEKEVELSELCDKHDEITASVKDDLSNEEQTNLLEDFSSNNLVIDTSFDTSRPYHSLEPEIRSDFEQFQQQEPLSPTEVESVTTTEVNSFLERSLPPDVASPIQSPVGYQSDLDITDPNHPLARCVYPLPPQNEGHGDGGFEERQDFHDDREVPQFESKEIVEEVEKIDTQIEEKNDETLQFEAIVEKTFNETFEPVFEHEMHTEIVEKALEVEEKPVVIETPSGQTLEERPLVPELASEPLVPTETIAAVGAVTAAAVVAAAAKTATKSTPSSAKKPTSGAKSPTKPPAKQPVPPKTTSATRVGSATAKPTPRTTAAPKSASASAGRVAPSKTGATPAARVPSAASRSLEKKPLTNGVAAKAAPARTALSARKPADLPKTTPRPAPSTTRASPLKPATTTRTTSATKTTSVSQMNGTSSATSATSRAKPPSMLSRTPATTKPATLSAPKPTTITRSPKAPLSATSTTTAPKRPTSGNVGVAAPKPRPPFTARPAPKPATDAEKQNKDSANKITASRTLTSRTTSATARPPSGTVGAAKKLDAKPNATKPTSFPRTNMAAAKATAKKQLDAAKTARNSQPRAVTKPEKPKLNGTAPPTDLTELNNLVNEQKLVENGSEILGDEEKSPIIDNKLIVENLIESNAD